MELVRKATKLPNIDKPLLRRKPLYRYDLTMKKEGQSKESQISPKK